MSASKQANKQASKNLLGVIGKGRIINSQPIQLLKQPVPLRLDLCHLFFQRIRKKREVSKQANQTETNLRSQERRLLPKLLGTQDPVRQRGPIITMLLALATQDPLTDPSVELEVLTAVVLARSHSTQLLLDLLQSRLTEQVVIGFCTLWTGAILRNACHRGKESGNCCSLLSFMLVSISGKYFFFTRVPLEGLPSRIWQIKGLDVGNPGMSGIYQFNPGMSGIYFF